MKKIKIILSLMLFLTPSVCFAKVIKINRISYDVTDHLYLQGLRYEALTNSLTLEDANYQSIQSEYDLNITLIGNNTLTNSRVTECLSGKNVTISGNGVLNLVSTGNGIKANSLEIDNTTIYGDVDVNLFTTSEEGNLLINNSNIVFNSKENAFNIQNGDITINDSNIVAKNVPILMGDSSHNLYLNNSNLSIIESNLLGLNSNIIHIDDNSKVFVYAKNGININYLNTNQSCLGSSDNITYHEDILDDDKYLKVNLDNTKELIELEDIKNKLENEKTELENKEKYLDSLEDELNKKENNLDNLENRINNHDNELKNRELELMELNDDLEKKEETLMNKEIILQEQDDLLLEKSISIEALSNILTGKALENETIKNNLDKEKMEIESLKRYIALKEKEVKDKENKLLLKISDESNDDLSVEEGKVTYGNDDNKGVLEDDILEGAYLYDKTNASHLNLGNIFYLLVSYIGGLITHIFTKRRLNG